MRTPVAHVLAVCAAAALLCSCATYAPPTSGQTARLKLAGNHNYARINLGTSWRTDTGLEQEHWPGTDIPAGKRIRVEQGVFIEGIPFSNSVSCRVRLFEPQEATTYLAEYSYFGLRDGCRMRLRRRNERGEWVPEASVRDEEA